MGFESQLDQAIRALRDRRIRIRRPRLTAAQARMVVEAVDGAALTAQVSARRGGKSRAPQDPPTGWTLRGGEPSRGHIGWYAEHAATMQSLGPFDKRTKAVAKAWRIQRRLDAAQNRIDSNRVSLGLQPLDWTPKKGGKARGAGGEYLVQTMRGHWTTVARYAQLENALERARELHARGFVVRVKRGREVVWKPTIEGRYYRGGKPRVVLGGPCRYYVRGRTGDHECIKGCPMTYPVGQLGVHRVPRGGVCPFSDNWSTAVWSARGKRGCKCYRPAGGKRRFAPEQLAKGAAAELEHAKTIKKLQRSPKLPVKVAAKLIAQDHLKEDPRYYDRLDAVEVPKRTRGLKAPRLKLLHRSGALRVYLVDSHAVRKLYGDWTMGGHHRVYPDFIPKNEVWIAEEVFDPERKLCTLHELNEYKLMGGGQDYDAAHDASTALEQRYRKGKLRGLDAALKRALRAAARS